MLRNAKIQMLVVLLAGTLIGYAAASGKLNPFQRGEAAPPPEPSASDKTKAAQPSELSCCSEARAKASCSPSPTGNC